jgi:hypothetical protein
MFTEPLHSDESYSIVPCQFVAGGPCLQSLCLAMNVYSDFTIPVFGCHVTVLLHRHFPVGSAEYHEKVSTIQTWDILITKLNKTTVHNCSQKLLENFCSIIKVNISEISRWTIWPTTKYDTCHFT